MKPGSWAAGRSALAARWVSDDHVVRADGEHFFFGENACRAMYVVYRAVDHEEYWRLQALSGLSRASGVDDDGLAPNEDQRWALTLIGCAPDGWTPLGGPMEIAFPSFGPARTYVVAKTRGADWPAAMNPGEWRQFTG